MNELKGLCLKCLGCNKLEDLNFKGINECEYYTSEQISIKQMKMEGLDENRNI